MKNILITNMFFRDYTGSELAALDIARVFAAQGCKVDIATFEIANPLAQEIAQDDNIALIDLTAGPALAHYDMIWGQHWPALTQAIALGAHAKKIISCSLSPYEALERLPLYKGYLSTCVANSYETQSVRDVADRSKIFLNSVRKDFLNDAVALRGELKKIAIIGNVQFENQDDFINFFEQQDISVICFGIRQKNFTEITPEILAEFDLVLTIGRTVQYCLCLGLPVYCYGRFGGDGYISQDRFQLNEDFNFSGRDAPIDYGDIQSRVINRIDVKKIGQDIIDGYQKNLQNIDEFRALALARYDLASNLNAVIKNLPDADIVAVRDSQEFKDECENTRLLMQERIDAIKAAMQGKSYMSKAVKRVKKLRKAIGLLLLIITAVLIYILL